MQGLPQQQSDGLTERERREQRLQQMQQSAATRQGAAPVAPAAQPTRITNNYMGPPEAPVQAEAPARAGPTGFVGFQQQLAANQDAAARMAGDAGKAALEGGGIANLRTDAGRQALLQRAYGKAAQVTGLDAALAGGAGGNYFGQLEAAYGSEAMARTAADRASARRDAAATQSSFNQAGAAQQTAQRQAEAAAKEQRIRDEVAQLQRQSDLPGTGAKTRNITPEQWAAMHGMTLEEWVRGGKRPAY